jgi:hypothetical protein
MYPQLKEGLMAPGGFRGAAWMLFCCQWRTCCYLQSAHAAGFPEKVIGAAAYPGDVGVDRLSIYGTITFDFSENIRTGGRLKV